MLWVKTQKVCATCVLWKGEREESYSFIEALCEEARCSLRYYGSVRGDSVCSHWVQMPIKVEFPTQA